VQLESKKPLLLQKWSEITDFPVSKMNYTFRIIQGNKNVFKFGVMLYESAQSEIDIILKGSELMRWILEGADDLLQKMASKQVTVRGISEFDNSNIAGIRRFQEFCSLRHIASSDLAPLVLIDGKEVLICLTNGGSNGLPENAIWTNHPELVGMLRGYFNVLWANAKEEKMLIGQV
jgi:hypothetical protein